MTYFYHLLGMFFSVYNFHKKIIICNAIFVDEKLNDLMTFAVYLPSVYLLKPVVTVFLCG